MLELILDILMWGSQIIVLLVMFAYIFLRPPLL